MERTLWITESFPHCEPRPGAVVASFPFAGVSPEAVIEESQRQWPGVPVIVRLSSPTLADAVRLAKLGASAVAEETAEIGPVVASVTEEAARRKPRASADQWRGLLVGHSAAIERVVDVIRLVGHRRSTVLIAGETGTGKEMAARAIHAASTRREQPLVSINCSALPENLLEAELFGHVRGAFTGAMNNRTGRFELAHRGTIFLDEIGDMPLDLQSKLLRVLQERAFERLGSSETVKVDVRVIAATNADLLDRVAEGKFREDLYYRLNVVPLEIPALRERLDDLPLLVDHFITKVCAQESIALKRVSGETLDRLARYEWPGNVRQLENAVEMAVALSGDRTLLYPADFPLPSTMARKAAAAAPNLSVALPVHGLDYEETIGAIELNLLEQALLRTSGNKKQAADLLNLNRTTLTAKLKSLAATKT